MTYEHLWRFIGINKSIITPHPSNTGQPTLYNYEPDMEHLALDHKEEWLGFYGNYCVSIRRRTI